MNINFGLPLFTGQKTIEKNKALKTNLHFSGLNEFKKDLQKLRAKADENLVRQKKEATEKRKKQKKIEALIEEEKKNERLGKALNNLDLKALNQTVLTREYKGMKATLKTLDLLEALAAPPPKNSDPKYSPFLLPFKNFLKRIDVSSQHEIISIKKAIKKLSDRGLVKVTETRSRGTEKSKDLAYDDPADEVTNWIEWSKGNPTPVNFSSFIDGSAELANKDSEKTLSYIYFNIKTTELGEKLAQELDLDFPFKT